MYVCICTYGPHTYHETIPSTLILVIITTSPLAHLLLSIGLQLLLCLSLKARRKLMETVVWERLNRPRANVPLVMWCLCIPTSAVTLLLLWVVKRSLALRVRCFYTFTSGCRPVPARMTVGGYLPITFWFLCKLSLPGLVTLLPMCLGRGVGTIWGCIIRERRWLVSHGACITIHQGRRIRPLAGQGTVVDRLHTVHRGLLKAVKGLRWYLHLNYFFSLPWTFISVTLTAFVGSSLLVIVIVIVTSLSILLAFPLL